MRSTFLLSIILACLSCSRGPEGTRSRDNISIDGIIKTEKIEDSPSKSKRGNLKTFAATKSKIDSKRKFEVEELLGLPDRKFKRIGSWYAWIYYNKVFDEWDDKTKHLVVVFTEEQGYYPLATDINCYEKGDVVSLGAYSFTFKK